MRDLLENSLPEETKQQIREIVGQEEGVSDIHHLMTRRIGKRIAIEMHIRMPGDTPLEIAHSHASDIERKLRDEFGADTHVSIHIEPTKKK